MITSLLSTFNLTEKERTVFAKVLESGAQPASHVAHLVSLPRNTTRDILDKLVKLGLLVRTRTGTTHFYSVESVPNIVRFLEIQKRKKEDEFNQQIECVKQFSEVLEAPKPQPVVSQSHVTVLQGDDALISVYEDTLTATEPIRVYSSNQNIFELLPDYFPSYQQRRTQKGVKVRVLVPDSTVAREKRAYDNAELRESRILARETFSISPEIFIYNDKVVIISIQEKVITFMQNQKIADAMKAIFELSWLQAGSSFL